MEIRIFYKGLYKSDTICVDLQATLKCYHFRLNIFKISNKKMSTKKRRGKKCSDDDILIGDVFSCLERKSSK